MRCYSRKARHYEWTTDFKARGKTNQYFKGAERQEQKQHIRNGDWRHEPQSGHGFINEFFHEGPFDNFWEDPEDF